MKVAGINGKKAGYSFGTIADIEIAINLWIRKNQDKTIIDIKIIPFGEHFDALILYNKICTKAEYLKGDK